MKHSRMQWNVRFLWFGLACGVSIFLVALLVQYLFPQWPHARHGAIVGGWTIFCLCTVPLVRRHRRNEARDGEDPRRHP